MKTFSIKLLVLIFSFHSLTFAKEECVGFYLGESGIAALESPETASRVDAIMSFMTDALDRSCAVGKSACVATVDGSQFLGNVALKLPKKSTLALKVLLYDYGGKSTRELITEPIAKNLNRLADLELEKIRLENGILPTPPKEHMAIRFVKAVFLVDPKKDTRSLEDLKKENENAIYQEKAELWAHIAFSIGTLVVGAPKLAAVLKAQALADVLSVKALRSLVRKGAPAPVAVVGELFFNELIGAFQARVEMDLKDRFIESLLHTSKVLEENGFATARDAFYKEYGFDQIIAANKRSAQDEFDRSQALN